MVVGSGEAVKGKGICKSVVVSLLEMMIQEDFLPIELGNLDLVLGMQWLRKEGAMTVNWKVLSMTFNIGSSWVVLRGDPTLARKEISLKMLLKNMGGRGLRFLDRVQGTGNIEFRFCYRYW